MKVMDKAEQLLNDVFGYPTFRTGQQQIISQLLAGKNSLAIMPTGGGKSLCYQIPAMLLDGITLVISPLISLMKDQVDALNQSGIPATYINSSVGRYDIEDRLHQIHTKQVKLVYIAPERLESFLQMIQRVQLSLVVVDEAHCISHWGHDFRPSYLTIGEAIARLPRSTIVAAFTATATAQVRQGIQDMLHIPAENTVFTSFQRANLKLSVLHDQNKAAFVENYMEQHHKQSGIIYCATRKEVDSLYEYLLAKDYPVARYHAGLTEEERKQAQEAFAYDRAPIMIATNAFGMGIDKSNVRYIIHFQLPRSIENYYQEAGRAGRDGEESECILLYQGQDVQIQRYLIEQSELSQERKQHELNNLHTMYRYCFTQSCLQQMIIRYFDDISSDSCGKCANCLAEADTASRDYTLEAQKMFSCIRRMKERFGLSMIVKVLKGSKSKRITSLALDKLSTYGILSDYTEKDLQQLGLTLQAEGYIETYSLPNSNLPLLRITDKAIEVLKGEQNIYLRPLETTASSNRNQQPAQTQRSILLDRLSELRREFSSEEKLPPYMILSDTTLRAIADQSPQNESELLSIVGMTQHKYRKYGARIVAITTAFPKTTSKQTQSNQSHVATYELLQAGKSLEEIASIRSLSATTIENHLMRCHSDGYKINWDQFISETYRDLIIETIDKLGAEKLKPLKEELPDEVSYLQIKAVIARQQLKASSQS